MPSIYLAPSTQDFNPTVVGNSEEYYMNRVADALEPWLRACGIRYRRNRVSMTTAQTIADSNAGDYDLHLALHSNAAPPDLSGQLRGSDVYYSRGSSRGRRAADSLVRALKTVYPVPEDVTARPTAGLGEVTKTRAPALLLELAYHDNRADAAWIRDSIPQIAAAIARGLCRYFGIPVVTPVPPRTGRVAVTAGTLNLRAAPSRQSRVVASMPKGAAVTVVGDAGNGWLAVEYGDRYGFAAGQYIR